MLKGLNVAALEFELQYNYKVCATPTSHSKEGLWGRIGSHGRASRQ